MRLRRASAQPGAVEPIRPVAVRLELEAVLELEVRLIVHEALDHLPTLAPRDRAHRVHQRAPGAERGRSGPEDPALQLRQLCNRLGARAPADGRPTLDRSEARAGR